MPPRTSSRFASRGAFDALRPGSDTEPEAESSADEAPAPVSAEPEKPSTPMTRTAAKKAAKEAREAKKAAKRSGSVSPAPPGSPAPAAAAPAPAAEPPVTPARAQPAAASRAPAAPAIQVAEAAAPEETDVSPPESVIKETQTQNKRAAAAPAAAAPAAAAPQQQDRLAVPSASAASRSAPVAPPKESTSSSSEEEEARKAYWKKVWERTLFTLLMIGGFLGLLTMGHPYVILLVLVIQVLVYREVTALFNIPGRPSVTGGAPKKGPYQVPSRDTSAAPSDDEDEDAGLERRREDIWSKTLSWYFFAVSNYFLYGESLIYYFKHIVFVDAYFIPFARHHRFLSFMLYIIGFLGFVLGLKRTNLKHQIGLFSWVHMSLLLTVYSSHFIVNNILEGMIWFFVPASLVICNDVFAYICGMLFGRTPLISLSPKKTVEGFAGAFLVTEVFAYLWATIFQRYNYMICPAVSLGMNAYSQVQCEPNTVFQWHAYALPTAVGDALTSAFGGLVGGRIDALPYTPFQWHALVMAAFASLVAPFGGFFASGFKRAFNIKDFGDSIPGHGGLTDRFDCQFLMGLFSYVYYSSLIREHHVTVGSVLQTVVTHLTVEDQKTLYRELARYLQGQGQLVVGA